MKRELKNLSLLEHQVLNVVWSQAPCTAELVRRELKSRRDLRDSTIRTVLRRLEEKGYVKHELENRTYVYRPAIEQQSAAINAVRQIINKFCNGSAEQLLVGMVADEMITFEELKQLAELIARTDDNQKEQT